PEGRVRLAVGEVADDLGRARDHGLAAGRGGHLQVTRGEFEGQRVLRAGRAGVFGREGHRPLAAEAEAGVEFAALRRLGFVRTLRFGRLARRLRRRDPGERSERHHECCHQQKHTSCLLHFTSSCPGTTTSVVVCTFKQHWSGKFRTLSPICPVANRSAMLQAKTGHSAKSERLSNMFKRRVMQAAKLGAVAGVAGTGIAAGSAWLTWQRLARRALPQTSGTLATPGLDAAVTVRRDRWGTPHIEAGSVEDGLFAQGFVSAQDRLWAMDFYRRVVSGRPSGVAGGAAGEGD